MRFSSLLLALCLYGGMAYSQAVPPNTGVCLDPEEARLIQLVNEYRQANGKSVLPSNIWLVTTGQWKVWDRIANPSAVGGNCNTHSWSNARPDLWQGVCYTPDHAQALQMWRKPFQISLGAYSTGSGYENTADSGANQTAQQALSQWQNSPSHNAVILNQGVWADVTFTGMGVGIEAGFAVLWFGDGPVSGPMFPCPVGDSVFSNGFE